MARMRIRIGFLYWLVTESLILDYRTFKSTRTVLKADPFRFVLTKYWILLKHVFKPYSEGDSTRCDGDTIFYDCRYGLAGYQRILTTHNFLLDICNVSSVETVVDVGANVGFFSLMCRKKFESSHIFCFEPVPEIYKLLEKNFFGMDKICLFNSAVGDHTGTTRMQVNQKNKAESLLHETGNLSIGMTTLDNHLTEFLATNKFGLIDLLKIDVESFESAVLKGARETLARTRFLFLEATLENNPNYTLSSLMSLLNSDSFNFQLIGFRNFSGTSQGQVGILELLLVNVIVEPEYLIPKSLL